MSGRKESSDSTPPSRPGLGESIKSRVRVGRACDRCKIKKSKCDGNTRCANCVASDKTCEYSARRRREARDWYWGMQDVIDEAFQRLYWACREGRGFPGNIPDESDGRVSTDAILRGLGLSPPAVDTSRSSGSRPGSVLDTQAQLFVPRSYQPPDIQPQLQGLPRTKTTTSTNGSSQSGQRRNPSSMMGVDGEEDDMADGISDGLPDGVLDSFGHQAHDGVGTGMNPAMHRDGNSGLMDGYLDMSAMHFGGGLNLGGQGPHMSMQAVHDQFQQNQQQQDMLPWPGTMQSVYQMTKSGSRRGRYGGNPGQQR